MAADVMSGKRLDPSGWLVRWDPERARRMVSQGQWRNLTSLDLATRLVTVDPDRVLAIDGDQQWSAGKLFASARRLASAFIARGLKPGDRISYQLPNWAEGIVIDLATTMAGLISNPLVPIYRENEVGFMMRDCGSRLIFAPAEFRGYDYRTMARRILPTLDHRVEVVILRGASQEFLGFEEFLASGEQEQNLPAVQPDAIKLIIYTSGTTGRAKGVLHTHNTLDVVGRQFATLNGLTADDVALAASPISHITGAILAFQVPWTLGARAVLMDTWNGDTAIDLILRHKCSFIAGATPFLRDLYLAARARDERLPSLRHFLCGGAAVPAELMRQASEQFTNCSMFRAHGCTEVPTTSIGVRSREMLELNANSDGTPHMSDLKLADPATGGAVRWGEEGEVLLRGSQMMLGYLREEDNVDAFDSDGYFRTGDLARYVHDDWIVISGRKKDLIIRAGEKFSPKEVEDMLLEHPSIEEVAIVAMPSEKTGEAACAFVVPRAETIIDLSDVTRFLEKRGLAKQKFPERVELATELPKTASGKVMKNVLREEAKKLVKSDSRPRPPNDIRT